ncbi:MAG: iron-containing alcohol dehydrogenase [Burkholderiales bacterium]|nr:iron-containing alcohol dehydrogenase [Burkholderiales bacterium]
MNMSADDDAALPCGSYQWPAQERVLFGRPAEDVVAEEAQRLGAERVFVVSSRSLARLADGPLQRIERALGARLAGRFGAISAHTPRQDVVAAAQAARTARADLLVAVGGGSVVDACKAVLLCLWHGLETPQAMDPFRHREGQAPQQAIRPAADAPPLLAVSTSLSAAEFTATAGVTEPGTRTKQSFRHRLLVPHVAVLDPRATLDTPMPMLLASGLRSVDHAIESFCSPRANAATELHSLEGLRRLAAALPAIQAAPQALPPRLAAQFGMWQAITGAAAGAGTGASHGIGYALGATFGIPHGQTSCAVLAAVLRWNAAVNAERQRALLPAFAGAATHAPAVAVAPDAASAVAALVRALGLPGSLRALGVQRSQLPEVARRALAYGPVLANPRPIRDVADVMQILELAWGE